jgi:hypothetical protein
MLLQPLVANAQAAKPQASQAAQHAELAYEDRRRASVLCSLLITLWVLSQVAPRIENARRVRKRSPASGATGTVWAADISRTARAEQARYEAGESTPPWAADLIPPGPIHLAPREATRQRESLLEAEKPDKPHYLRKPPSFLDCCIFPTFPSDACMYCRGHFSLGSIPSPSSEETQAVAKTKTSTKNKKAARPGTKAASRKTKASSTPKGAHRGRSIGDKEVPINRRRGPRREEDEGAASPKPAALPVKLERRKKVNRRRQIDPTTCERDYSDDEVEFMNALDDYKRASGRMFPTCSEVLEVVRSLGYVRLSPSELTSRTAADRPDAAVGAVAVEVDELTAAGDRQ